MAQFRGPDIQAEFPEFRPKTSVARLLFEALRENGDSLAMVEGGTGRCVSFAGLLERSLRVAAGLRGAGVAAGDCVVICCDKSILAFSFILGTIFTGATSVLCPTTHSDSIHHLTKGHKIKAVICDPKYRNSVLDISVPLMEYTPILTAVLDPDDQPMTTVFASFVDFDIFEASDVNTHIPIIHFSSGTTDEPKGIQISDIGLQVSGISFMGYQSILLSAPLFWYSSTMILCSSILKNFQLILSNSGDTQETLRLIQTYKIQTMFVSSGTLVKFANEPSLHKYDVSSIKSVLIGGDVVPSTVMKSFVTTVFKGNMKLNAIYGSTEIGILTKCNDVEALGHSGYALVGTEIKIVDDEGSVVPVGQVGHVMGRSPGLTPGYWDGRSLPVDQEGFFKLGDVGFMDECGHLHARGRLVDIIEYRGCKVSPWEIEDVLLSHPGVANAAVVGRPHPSDGHRPAAFVVRRATSDVTAEQLVMFVDGVVEDNKKLRGGVIFIEELPMTIIGKISRKILRDIIV